MLKQNFFISLSYNIEKDIMKKTFIILVLVFITNVMFSQTLQDFSTFFRINETYESINTFGYFGDFKAFNPEGVIYDKQLVYNYNRKCYFTTLTIKSPNGDIKCFYCFKKSSGAQKSFNTIIIADVKYAHLFIDNMIFDYYGKNKIIIE